MKTKVKQLDFTGMSLFCGIDVHKKSWRVDIRNAEFNLENFSQNPDAPSLLKHLKKNYPGAYFQIAYEAGFCGFGIQRYFEKHNVNCLVINPADVPSSDKDRKRKQDKIDASKISRELGKGRLEGIYIPGIEMEHARSLLRQRARIIKDQTRCKNRIWSILMFNGLELEHINPNQYWSKLFISKLRELASGQEEALNTTLDIAIEEYLQIRKINLKATRAIRKLSRQPGWLEVQEILQSIPGVGLINAMVFQTEIQDMKRFKTLDKLCSFVGIVPDTRSSGDKDSVRGITHRSNVFLRLAVVESSWTIIRKDPAMLMKYRTYCKRMSENKAIIKIAKHLLSRMRHLWLNGVKYEKGVVS